MENFTNPTTFSLSILGLIVSIGALVISYLSYKSSKEAIMTAKRSAAASEKSAVASERSAIASERSAVASERSADATERSVSVAEKSLITIRPFVKLSTPIALDGVDTDNSIEISIQLTNSGTLTALITSARVDTIEYGGQQYGHEFGNNNIILYPGDNQTLTATSAREFTLQESSPSINYLQINPGDFVFKIKYCAREDKEQTFEETVRFPSLVWAKKVKNET